MEEKVYNKDWLEENKDGFWDHKAARLSRSACKAIIEEVLSDEKTYKIYVNPSDRKHGLVKAQISALYRRAYPLTKKEADEKRASLNDDPSFQEAFTNPDHADFAAADSLMEKLIRIGISGPDTSESSDAEEGSLEQDIIYNEARRTILGA